MSDDDEDSRGSFSPTSSSMEDHGNNSNNNNNNHHTTNGSSSNTGTSPVVSPDDKQGVKDPATNDVLCGRGGSINSHPGNERFRTLVEKRKRVYLTARFKREKRLIASSIVSEIRNLNGRFLQRDSKSGLWKDIGDEKARDKTSQALRENAPSIRAEIEEEINEQRAELYKDELPSSSLLSSNNNTGSSNASPYSAPPPAANGGYYSASSWYNSYYGGYAAHAPPPPHGSYPPPPPYSGYPPPPHSSSPHYDYHYANTHHHHHPEQKPPPPQPYMATPFPKSTFAETADFISSGAESIRNWTKTSLSFGGGNSIAESTVQSTGSSSLRTSKKKGSEQPISYQHKDGDNSIISGVGGDQHDPRGRKMVKFREDSVRQRRVRPCYSPVQSNSGNNNNNYYDIEPQAVDIDTNASLMSQVASHILGNFGSWDVCGTDQSVYDEKVPFPKADPSAFTQDTEMGVEWEGQEVQLLDDNKKDEKRMPPPLPPRQSMHSHGAAAASSSVGAFSSIGSCHSWFPEQVGAAASYFSGRDDHAGSMDMEYSAAGSVGYGTAENFSIGESVGGGSLTKVFENEAMSSPTMSHRDLTQIPSWERSLRSKSPLSIGTTDDDDESLISKCSSRGALSSVPSVGDEMTWTRE